jgi:hypothetical protein
MASDPGHNDDWEANYEDLMAMEDSYGSGVEDLSSAAMEIANARMAEQKKLREEMLKNRGIQPGDRVTVAVRVGAPYPERVKRYHYATDPFGTERRRRRSRRVSGLRLGRGRRRRRRERESSRSGLRGDERRLRGRRWREAVEDRTSDRIRRRRPRRGRRTRRRETQRPPRG